MPREKLERQPFEDQFPNLGRYVVACSACGQRGRDETVDWDNFRPAGFGLWITEAVKTWYTVAQARGCWSIR